MKSDAELMALYRKGSRNAFEELFARHHRKVIHFCYRMTGDHARAEEAAQEVFLRIARAASTYQPTARFTTWMYTIARRTTLNFLRDEKEEGEKVPIHATGEEGDPAEGFPLPGPADWGPEQVAWEGELQARFAEALQRLPEVNRAAFVLNRGEGLSYEEVATVLGITVQAVKSRIFRARETLLEELSGLIK
ncbi:MAG TPA: RNA polymerase sigma factor [Candidatus Deferrimicrobiaceae bacterium]|nr:RNA polymerase sigma factor [Candidatus Deferrimicrobiaceae bacterium]